MDDNTRAIIWSSEGVQQGDPLSSFLFSLIYKPVLERIETTRKQSDPRTQVLAILDDTIINICARFTQIAFQIATEALQTINICTVLRKTSFSNHQTLDTRSLDINPDIQIRSDGIPMLRSAIGNAEFMNEFLQSKLAKTESLLSKSFQDHMPDF